MNDSLNMLNFYVQNNKNKYLKVKPDEERYMSKAEQTILSCINVLSYYSEVSDNFDLVKTIKMLFAKDFNDKDIQSLTNKEELINLKKEYSCIETEESLIANVSNELVSKNSDITFEKYPYLKKLLDDYETLRKKIRKGHVYWNARVTRIESILEHIYGTCLLALGLESECNYFINNDKILLMLLLHETEEIDIDDLTEWDISSRDKQIIGSKAVNRILSSLKKSDKFIDLINEFNSKVTPESNFAYLIDKLEYDLQVKMYDQMGAYDFKNVPFNVVTESKEVQKILSSEKVFGVFDVHYEYDKSKYTNYPIFRRVLENAKNSCF